MNAVETTSGIAVQPARQMELSYAQERIWLESALNPYRTAYNLPLRIDLTGELRVWALRLALNEIFRRHEVLRTRYAVVRGRPQPVVDPPAAVVLPMVDLTGVPEGVRQRALRTVEVAEARRLFDLAVDPVLRTVLVRTAARRHSLLITRHHVASDGWSLGILLTELAELYRAFVAGRPDDLPELPVQYPDFAGWQRGRAAQPDIDERVERWVRRLWTAPRGLDLLARPAADAPTAPAESMRISLPAALVADARMAARALRTTVFTILLTAFGDALHRASGQDQIVIGTPVAGRNWVTLEPLIGAFATVLPLCVELSGRPAFGDLVRRNQRMVQQALDDQDVPIERVIEALRPQRSPNDNPLFDVVFALQNTPGPQVRLHGLRSEVRPSVPVAPKFAIAVTATEQGDRILLDLEIDPARLSARTAGRILTDTQALLAAGLARPDEPLPYSLSAAPPTPRDRPDDKPATSAGAPTCLHQQLDAIAVRHPDAIALSYCGRQVSYRALVARSGQLAAALLARQVGPESLVGLCVDPSPELVIAAAGILRSGAVYVPIDPADPPARQAQICAAAGLRVVVTRRGLRDVPVDRLDVDEPDQRTPCAGGRSSAQISPANGAYAIYTSGSTGAPKGVLVTLANLAALLAGTRSALPFLAAPQVFSMTHSPAFDVSVFELWAALSSGGRVVVVPASTARAPDELWQCLIDEQVTVLSQTPSAFSQLAPVIQRSGTTGALRAVLLAGERCDVAGLRRWYAAFDGHGPTLVNLYGITETTVHTTVRLLDAADADRTASPIGSAVPGQSLAVLNQHGEPVPEGGKGEIHVGGAGVARGYLGRPGLTAERFLPDGYAATPGARRYRSGDRAEVLPGGELSYLGRFDNQVKVRGYRIELGEIEAALSGEPGVRSAAVVVRTANERRALIGYVVPESRPDAPDEAGLRGRLAQRLPAYLVPARIVVVDRLPLNRNGKVDREALAARSVPPPSDGGSDHPRTDTERALAIVVAELLGYSAVEPLGVRDSIFDLGADSLLVTQLHARIVEMFRVDPTVRQVYQALDLRSLAATVDSLRAQQKQAALRSALAELELPAEEHP
ncbi:amino acid adenylation domain-containing protein [Kribbella sp. NBC_01505]|uniref:non-ribosomal peptide synthetase n=1 Tax=Kribbella sp. NBC_01505 TaxID=2903580 RepID=UPI0038664D2B